PAASMRHLVFSRRSSVVFCRTSRPFFRLASNCSSRSRRVFHSCGLYFEPPGGLMSSSSIFTTMSSQLGMVATMVARLPSGIDFSCGFQSFFPAGTRSSVLRIPTASRSSSASNSSVIFMVQSPCFLDAILLENDRFISVEQNAVFDMPADGSREHEPFDVPALLDQVLDRVAMRYACHGLLDDGPVIKPF